jgi:hypothetical protein
MQPDLHPFHKRLLCGSALWAGLASLPLRLAALACRNTRSREAFTDRISLAIQGKRRLVPQPETRP